MKRTYSTTILALLLASFSILFHTASAHPMPANIIKEGRDFNSRFAPIARPVFPRSYFENITAVVEPRQPSRSLPLADAVENMKPALVKREYPAGPTASALVFRSEPLVFAPKQAKEKRAPEPRF